MKRVLEKPPGLVGPQEMVSNRRTLFKGKNWSWVSGYCDWRVSDKIRDWGVQMSSRGVEEKKDPVWNATIWSPTQRKIISGGKESVPPLVQFTDRL